LAFTADKATIAPSTTAETFNVLDRMNLHSRRAERGHAGKRLTQKMHEIYNKSTEIRTILRLRNGIVFSGIEKKSSNP
jgi:hypothetical protein